MNRSQYITTLYEDHRAAYQVLITPTSAGAVVRFIDDHLGNPALKFPPVLMSQEDLFNVIPHNKLTQATHTNATERGDSYGLFVDARVIAQLAQWGEPHTATKYQHTFKRSYPTTLDFNRDGMMSGRV